MSLPPELIQAIDEAIASIDQDITNRRQQQRSTSDLDFLKQEMIEARAGSRKQVSQELSRMIVDSMDWDQPCLKAFNHARAVLRKFFHTKP